MRFHVLGIPHTQTNKLYCNCAYTMKVYKLCHMLKKSGHDVFHYGVSGGNPDCTENISVVNLDLFNKVYQHDWKSQFFQYSLSDQCYLEFNKNAIKEIKSRLEPRDFLLCAWGRGHQYISDQIGPAVLSVESGIGYDHFFSKFRVFESYAWMHYLYGKEGHDNGAFFDSVIPNFFDSNDFEYSNKKEDWFLYLGRIIKRKGIELAVQAVEKIGAKLIIAGQGQLKNDNEFLDIKSDNIEFVGFADVEKRKHLLSKAKALFVPTYYLEPFGGVAIESMLSGTPVITTDWGGFAETVVHGKTGFRCRTMEQFCWAATNINLINSQDCRNWAINNYSMDRVSQMYNEYFSMLYTLWDKGWYSANNERRSLDWLSKQYV